MPTGTPAKSLVALGGDGQLVRADEAGWDLQHKNGARLEAKPSAARQT
jgi:hypothetical protein